MKFRKAMIAATAIVALSIPAMASNGRVMKENANRNKAGYFNTIDNSSTGQKLVTRGGAGRGNGSGVGKGSANKYGTGAGRNGSVKGPRDGSDQRGGGHGSGDGTGNDGSAPRDGSGNGAKTGDCPQT